jgi:acetylornithine/N-succinyldiaminopimelate aminotransferase
MTATNDYTHLMTTYAPAPLELVRGEGAYVWDASGERYLDFVAGIAVANLGHCPPKVVAAIEKQAATLIHVSNLFRIPGQAELSRFLCEHSFAEKVFFCNSGAEAMEAAIKLARRYGVRTKGAECYRIVSFEGSFHGRTFGAMTATGQARIHDGFGPLVPGFTYIPYGDLASAERAVDERTCAIIVEPIQGESGVVVPPPDFLPGLREICDRAGCLLIFDEIQTGMGRCGTLFAYEGAGVVPDVMTLAKGLASGLPMGAALSGPRCADVFTPGSHASTFGGNPLAVAAATATLRATIEDGVCENCREAGNYFTEKLEKLSKKYDSIREVRGRGLMIGVEVTGNGREILERMRDRHVLINLTAEKVLRFLPPLIVGRGHVDEVIDALSDALAVDARRNAQ